MDFPQGYSAQVALSLIVGGTTLALSNLGPKEFIVRDDCPPFPAGDAELVVDVDGQTKRTPVFLPNGIKGAGARVLYL